MKDSIRNIRTEKNKREGEKVKKQMIETEYEQLLSKLKIKYLMETTFTGFYIKDYLSK